jgi:broad specificity phosphatase PhoE
MRPPPVRKTFFLIRHGESKWNEAQSALNLGGMLDHDHCLSRTGVEQCLDFNRRWHEFASVTAAESATIASSSADSAAGGSASATDHAPASGSESAASASSLSSAEAAPDLMDGFLFEQKFMRADVVYSSPLTRALQTALLTLKGHPGSGTL